MRGAVPGAEGSWVEVRDAAKAALPKEAPKPRRVQASRRGSRGMKLDVVTLDAKKAGSIDLDDEIFGITEIRADILQRMVKYQLAKRRAGTHKTLSRGEVARSHSKLYKQKGTGQARHGAANAPIFRGGGHAHNRLPRDYSARPDQEVPRAGAAPRALVEGQGRRHRRARRATLKDAEDRSAASSARQAQARQGADHRRRRRWT